jgi:hypothetical protein
MVALARFLGCLLFPGVRMATGMAVRWEAVRRVVLRRDDHRCVRCGREACDVHHRQPKGMGGTSNEEVAFGLANLISLCRECHSFVHANPLEAYKTGYLVHSWDDPETIAVLTKSWGTVSFRSDGSSESTGVCDLFLCYQDAPRDTSHQR